MIATAAAGAGADAAGAGAAGCAAAGAFPDALLGVACLVGLWLTA